MTNSDGRGRNREQTEAAILAAAKALLAEQGFQGLGVNAVARAAGCDKQLIYRYFGGIDGLVAAIGDDLATWLQHAVSTEQAPPASYAALVEAMLLAFLAALRASPLVQKIAAWEIAEPSPLVARLSQARALSLARWVEAMRGELRPPADRDAPALNAVLIAAVQHLVLSGASTGGFAGIALHSDADWERARQAICRLARGAYQP